MYFKFTLQKWLGSMSKLKYPNSVFLLVVFIQGYFDIDWTMPVQWNQHLMLALYNKKSHGTAAVICN